MALNDENIEGNTISGSFNEPLETTGKIRAEIKTDMHADENHFFIKDRDGNILHEFGPYEPNLAAIYNETITLDENKIYCFEITDDWWDGMLGTTYGTPKGYLKLYNENGDLIIQNYNIKLFGERVFFHTSKELSILDRGNDKQEIIVFYNDDQQTIDISFTAFDNGVVHLSLYAVTGALLLEKSIQTQAGQNNEISLPASKYGAGVYLLHINQGKQNRTQKFVIH
jgi:hypothetical protein